MRYRTLIRILDQLRLEAPEKFKSYHPRENQSEKIHQARSKALVHLYLKAKFGLLKFADRISYITDDTGDGGIDGYYIDKMNKKLFLIQSKLKSEENSFEERSITADELIKMEVTRILRGEATDSNGVVFNGKIHNFQLAWRNINDQANYTYIVIILGNLTRYNDVRIKRLIDNSAYEIYDYQRIYNELVFPLCSGTYYDPDEIIITLNLGQKEQSTLKQQVTTKYGDFNIRVVFVPVAEIGKVLSKYKNSILRYNPRNYLSLSSNKVNQKIKDSILDGETNDFSILNNGITLICEKFRITESTGEVDTGQIIITNPQIINGGQTAYTLSKVYEAHYKEHPRTLDNKEVLLKAIIVGKDDGERLDKFISEISNATNQQTRVEEADRRSNEEIQVQLQDKIFESFGFFYERKRGQYYYGIEKGYIEKSELINRYQYIRAYYAFLGYPRWARQRGSDTLFKKQYFHNILDSVDNYKKMIFSYKVLQKLYEVEKGGNEKIWGSGLRYGKMAIIAAIAYRGITADFTPRNINVIVDEKIESIKGDWVKFEKSVRRKKANRRYKDDTSNEFDFNTYYKGITINDDIKANFSVTDN